MKEKLTALFLIAGAILGATYPDLIPLPTAAISIIGGFILGISFTLFLWVYSGKVWGVKIKGTGASKIVVLFSGIGVILGGYSLIIAILAAFFSLTRFEIMSTVIHVLGFCIPLAISPFIGKKIAENHIIAKGKNALVLNNFDFFREIDANMDEAVSFVVGFEGVALYSGTNYCYAVYRYTDFQLGELSTPKEVAMVGTYFVQKYHKNYTFKLDVEVIPGEPGQTVVAVGTGGIGIARIQGSPDKRLFRSYIFTKKR